VSASRARMVLAVALGGACAGVFAACFPDYFVRDDAGARPDATTADGPAETGATSEGGGTADGPGGGGGDGATEGGSTETGTTSDAGDGSATGDGGGGDASVVPDAPSDGPPLGAVALIEGGSFDFQVALEDAGTIDAHATLTYTLAVDKYLTTIGEFAAWVDAGLPLPNDGAHLDPGPYASVMTWDQASFASYAHATYYTNSPACGTGTSSPVPTYTAPNLAAHPDYPINCVTWAQALAYCASRGKRLLTDTEWRVVATSEGTRQPYPWGSQSQTSCAYLISNDGTVTNCNFPVPVGSAPQGVTRDGVLDIVGEVATWTWDFAPTNPYKYPSTPTTNYAGPSDPTPNDTRVWLGGDWSTSDPALVRSIQPGPDYGAATEGFDGTGIRCAKSM